MLASSLANSGGSHMIIMLVGVFATALRFVGGKSIADDIASTTFGESPVHVYTHG